MKLYIFPGLGETKKDYEWLISKAEKKYSVIFLNLDFNNNSFDELKKIKLEKNSTVFGFSIGALVAYKNVNKIKKGIYCSISNILGKDTIGKEKIIANIFNNSILEEFKKEKYNKPKAKEYIIFCGEKELDLKTELDRSITKIKNFEMIQNTGHVLNARYRKKILENI